MNPHAPPRYINAKEIAARLDVSLDTAYGIIHGLPHVRIGRLLKVRDDVFVGYLKRQEQDSQKKWHVLS